VIFFYCFCSYEGPVTQPYSILSICNTYLASHWHAVTGDLSGANKIAVAASKVAKATAAEIGAQSLFAAAVGGQAGVTYNRVYYRCVLYVFR
jgi:hypothetical protein